MTTVEKIIRATVCLHNYLLSTENADYKPQGFVDSYADDGSVVQGTWRNETTVEDAMDRIPRQGSLNYTFTAKETRDNYCALLNNDQ